MAQPPATGRIDALDGLRGIAALIVVVHHTLLGASLAIATVYTDGPDGPVLHALAQTPLRIVWAGHEAVLVFFALSGFALAWPFARGKRFAPVAYYSSRALRLYLPVWAAILAAVVFHLVFDWHRAGTWWLGDHGREMSVGSAARDASLFGLTAATAAPYFGAIWSLRWEVIFSALLPLYLILARGPRWSRLLLVVVCIVVMAQPAGAGYTTYLPVFLLGVLIAFERDELAGWARHFASPIMRRGGMLLAIAGLTAEYWAPGPSSLLPVYQALSAAALVAAVASGAGARLLCSPPIRWLGQRSFSLYLVHEIVVVSVIFTLGPTGPSWLAFLVAIPAAVLATEAFFRAVERPSHRLARRAARRRAGAALSPA